ncbi:MAG TPA: tRNA preQ1(34) S-adenosylmethionine ribosyltransferase-isomerase QueA [Patescibacteria group bacterium]|nr:tRNA preQ1(34) S-adenosylmethionine ribosyltransferase-isomerase QueA [Patescibacteria group bacterium]
MKLSDFNYNLPKELIANCHIEPRDHSRLFLYNRNNGKAEHKHFFDIIDYLDAGDVLVFNDTKVFKARIFGKKITGGRIEFLLMRPIDSFVWETLVKGKISEGEEVSFENETIARLISKEKDGTCRVGFNKPSEHVFQYLEKYGELPLPPYVNPKVRSSGLLQGRTLGFFYQTIYADKIGSVAAPTAGFHFTLEMIEKIKAKGIKILHITLHVGPGTFRPVKTEKISEHQMHEEFFEVKKEVWDEIINSKKEGKRIVAVGTTTTRTLEAIAQKFSISNFQFPINDSMINIPDSRFQILDSKFIGSTDIFIYPPYRFQIVDALITNFHLPKSTLLMLVSAFIAPGKTEGVETIKKLYNIAVEEKYRFFSFGDSMFIK